MEANAVLLAKNGEETGKQIFGLYGLAQGASDLKEYALHFDLTVPFARYVLDREHELTFPFKRYQIQPVRRGERTQKGRFREFFQCDIDVIWRKDGGQAYLYYDAEILVAISQTLQHIIKTMQIDDVPVLHISNRKLLMGFLLSFMNAETATAVASLIDKYQKLGAETFRAALKDFALDETSIQKLMTFITTQYHSSSL
ncbi:MAG: hypothetical protein LBP53_02450 [Candidatus Peribacteria bacterium]|nr:hypothetical protein [Candidatus Peribacteria bacterium]